MDELFYMKEEDIEYMVGVAATTERDKLLNAIEVAITSVPSISKITSKYIGLLIEGIPELKNEIENILVSECEDDISTISKVVYGNYLGANTSYKHDDPVTNVFNGLELKHEIPKKFGELFKKFPFPEIFYCHSIIQKFNFYKAECRFRLKEYSNEMIIESMLIAESLSDVSMIIELCKYEGFFRELYKNISRFNRKTEIVALIFVVYYKPNQHIRGATNRIDNNNKIDNNKSKFMVNTTYSLMRDDLDLLIEMFDKEVERYAMKIGSIAAINKLLGRNYKEADLPVIKFQEFEGKSFANKKEFFGEFLKLTSPTPTHFLSYLEYYKEEFRLDDENQKMFVDMLDEFHRDNLSFLEIVKGKLVKFKIVDEKYVK